jgi:hypothetical protein
MMETGRGSHCFERDHGTFGDQDLLLATKVHMTDAQ